MSNKTPLEKGDAARLFDEALRKAEENLDGQPAEPAADIPKKEVPAIDPAIAEQLRQQGVEPK